jgi:protein-L-isoaspartate(D-aspartate) O-methyltransferase
MNGSARMLQDIQAEVELTRRYIGKAALDERVMQAMQEVSREAFVPSEMIPFAYDNRPLPIGEGQTISQPYIVALMTDLLCPQDTDIVLEVGTGCGYQAAILSRVVKQVYTIEVVEPLARRAKARLEGLGYTNIETRHGDGYYGWKEHAPFDGIIVTAAASHTPPALVEQIKPGGRMVIPIGLPHFYQELMFVEKDAAGKVTTRDILGVSFVPLTGEHHPGHEGEDKEK